jgi:hypothetical protein
MSCPLCGCDHDHEKPPDDKPKGMRAELDTIGQTIMGAILLISDQRRGVSNKNDPRELKRIDNILARLEDASHLIYGG